MTDAPPTSPPRPSLEQAPGKPDVLVSLQNALEIAGTFGVLEISPKDGLFTDIIATITYLREANHRHCKEEEMLKEARARVAELEALIRAMRKAASDRVDYFDKTADTLAGDPRMGLPHMRSVARREAAERIVADMSLIVIESGLI